MTEHAFLFLAVVAYSSYQRWKNKPIFGPPCTIAYGCQSVIQTRPTARSIGLYSLLISTNCRRHVRTVAVADNYRLMSWKNWFCAWSINIAGGRSWTIFQARTKPLYRFSSFFIGLKKFNCVIFSLRLWILCESAFCTSGIIKIFDCWITATIKFNKQSSACTRQGRNDLS